MDEVLLVFSRLKALLEQYDHYQQNLAQLEMQNEVMLRLSGEYNKDIGKIKTDTAKATKVTQAQIDAAERAIKDITGIAPSDLRNKLTEVGLYIEQAGEASLEEKKTRGAFEILAASDAFGDSSGDTRADFEQRLSTLKNIRDNSFRALVKSVESCINRSPIVGATDSVLSQLKDRSIIDTKVLLTV